MHVTETEAMKQLASSANMQGLWHAWQGEFIYAILSICMHAPHAWKLKVEFFPALYFHL
jgi:hypothetical protein